MKQNLYIQRIRHLINSKNLSFIIGAGFSKNMSTYFPSWSELLEPLVMEMYGISDNEDIRRKINEIGYLGVASEFVRRKGFHEAIDVYIEEHTPIIKATHGSSDPHYEVWLNGVKKEDADITCHQLLIDLGVKHIFTFNYDNCLDMIGNTHKSNQILTKIWGLNKRYGELVKIQNEYELSTANFQCRTIHDDVDEKIISKQEDILETHKTLIFKYQDSYRELKELSTEIENSEKNRNVFKHELHSLQGRINSLRRQRDSHYQLITCSHMLSLTDGMRNIYKLHGSLRLERIDDFGFDGDRHSHYVITEEDYKLYPVKHEPFVNYMKISLLKGSFCIMGFSGDDPNFLSWISWVKDVVDTSDEIKRELSQTESARFYYIHVGDTPLTSEKKLLLKNHYIELISLYDLYPTIAEPKAQIIAFLKDISSTSTQFPQIKGTWKHINEYVSKLENSRLEWDLSPIVEEINYIYDSQKINRIPIQENLDHYNREHVLRVMYHKFKNDLGNITGDETKLVYSALNEEMLLLSHYFDELQIHTLLQNQSGDILEKLVSLYNKEQVLSNSIPATFDSKDKYLKVWHSLIKLDFSGAKNELSAWQPSKDEPIDNLRKAQFESLFGNVDNNNLDIYLNPETYSSVQDYLNALVLIPRICNHFVFDKNGGMYSALDSSREEQKLKAECIYLQSFEDIVDKLISSISKIKRVKPFGNNSKEYTFGSNNVAYVDSFKVLSIFFELGVPLHIGNIILFPEEKWYAVFEQIYEDFPYPCLFYSLQYNSKNLTKRVSQKLLYNSKLYIELPKIVKSMFSALRQKECPSQYRQAIMHSLPILIQGVNPIEWGVDFKEFFNSSLPYSPSSRKYDDLNYRLEDFYELVTTGLRLTSNKEFKLNTIANILETKEKIGNWENHLIIEAMRSLTEYDFRSFDDFTRITQSLQWLCSNASKSSHIYVLFNLVAFVDSKELNNSLENLSDNLIESDCALIKALSYHLPYNSILLPRLNSIILKSESLWRNGINGNGVSIGYSFLDIADISEYIAFNQDELKVIWERMISSFTQIVEFYNKEKGIESDCFFLSHFTSLLEEMNLFILNNKLNFLSRDEIESKKREIISLRMSISSSDSQNIVEMIVRDETSDAISMLLDISKDYLFSQHQTEYILIANRLILRDSQSLNSCMRHFSWVVEKYHAKMAQDIFRPLLQSILLSYERYFNGDIEWNLKFAQKDVFEKCLIKINSVLNQWGCNNLFWDSYTPRYYN